MPHLSVAVVPTPDQVVVRLTGEAGVATLDRLGAALTAAAALGTRQVVVDVAGVRFTDEAPLLALTEYTQALAPAGRACRLVGAPGATRRMVAGAGLAGRLELDGLLDAVPPRPAPDEAAPAPARRPRLVRGAGRWHERRPGRGRSAPAAESLRRWR
ncbi:STAS domain-containing protein [Blastococcus sp. SYSU D00820]